MSTPAFHDDAAAWTRPTPAAPAAPAAADTADTEPSVLQRVLVPIGLAVLVGVLGGPLGLLWAAIGPRVQVTMTADGPNLVQSEPEQFVADEGWYIVLNIGFAVLVTVLVWLVLRRHRGPAMLLALAAGTGAAGIFAWWAGSHLGLAHYHDLLKHAAVGSQFGKPVGLRAQWVGLWHGWLPFAKGDVLIGGVASTITYILFAGFSPYSDLRSAGTDAVLDEQAPYAGSGGYPAGTWPGAQAEPAGPPGEWAPGAGPAADHAAAGGSSNEPGPDRAAPDQAAPDEAAPDQAAPDRAAPDQAGPDEAAPGEAAPDHLGSDEAAPDEVAPDQTGPDQAAPDGAAPDRVGPDLAVPAGQVPGAGEQVDQSLDGRRPDGTGSRHEPGDRATAEQVPDERETAEPVPLGGQVVDGYPVDAPGSGRGSAVAPPHGGESTSAGGR